MVIESISEVQKFNILFIAYKAGSSGEFLAAALTESFSCFSKTPSTYNNSRYIFFDFFFRGLMGNIELTEQEIVNRINSYLSRNKDIRQWQIGLMHPNTNVQQFVERFLTPAAVIQIDTSNQVAHNFQEIAAVQKIPNNFRHSGQVTEFRFQNSIIFDWYSCMLGNEANLIRFFDQLQTILNNSGNYDIFKEKMVLYLNDNRSIIESAKAKYSYG